MNEEFVFVCKKCGDEIGIKYEPQQGEPVAWLNKDDDGRTYLDWEAEPNYVNIPLYTAPRELSDEEIRECKLESLKQYYTFNPNAVIDTPKWFDELFAKNLLKKASEK